MSDEDGQAILDKKVNDVRLFGTDTAKQKAVNAKQEEKNTQVNDAVASIKAMKSYKDLHKLCEDAKLPNSSWGEMKIPALKEYLIGKIAPEAASTAEDETITVTDAESGEDVTDEVVSIEDTPAEEVTEEESPAEESEDKE